MFIAVLSVVVTVVAAVVLFVSGMLFCLWFIKEISPDAFQRVGEALETYDEEDEAEGEADEEPCL